jgi:hypothetical protein
MNLRGAYLSRRVADDKGVVMVRSWFYQGSLLNGRDCAGCGHKAHQPLALRQGLSAVACAVQGSKPSRRPKGLA